MGNGEYHIVGIVDFKEQSNLSNAEVLLPHETAMQAVGINESVVNQVYISLDKASSLGKVRTTIGELLPGFSVITNYYFRYFTVIARRTLKPNIPAIPAADMSIT